jgi:hypothetical protein
MVSLSVSIPCIYIYAKGAILLLRDFSVVVAFILSSGSMRGLWIEGLGFFIYVRRINIDPVNSFSVAQSPVANVIKLFASVNHEFS